MEKYKSELFYVVIPLELKIIIKNKSADKSVDGEKTQHIREDVKVVIF